MRGDSIPTPPSCYLRIFSLYIHYIYIPRILRIFSLYIYIYIFICSLISLLICSMFYLIHIYNLPFTHFIRLANMFPECEHGLECVHTFQCKHADASIWTASNSARCITGCSLRIWKHDSILKAWYPPEHSVFITD